MRDGAVAVFLLTAAAAHAVEVDPAVLRILQRSCAECHSERIRTSGFSVATPASILAGGNKHGKSIVAGDAARSPLVKLLKGELQPRMPVGKPLPQDELQQVERWIASLPAEAPPRAAEWRWPFDPPVQRVPPEVRNKSWARNEIDAFVLAKLEERGIPPAKAASARTLARRLSLDLTGVPPAPEEMEAFLSDAAPDAYERLIDRLLTDPRYGERWGRHWLDLARYGETSGLEGDGMIGNAWRYRDWVIDAFNANMPYDRFVMQQIAGGDEHSKTRNNYQPDPQGLIPTGFLRVAPWDRSNLVAAEVRQNYLSEVSSTTASVFLGLTLGCARCHDHKYDPIPQRDFYRFQAFFQAVQAGPPVDVPYRDEAFAALAKQKIKEYEDRIQNGAEQKALAALEDELLKKLIAGRKERASGTEYKAADLRLELRLTRQRIFTSAEKERHAELLENANRTGDAEEQAALDRYEAELMKKLTAAYASGSVNPATRFEALDRGDVRAEAAAKYSGKSIFTAEEKDRHAALASAVDILRRRVSRWRPSALAVTNVAGPPTGSGIAPTHILFRGDYLQPRETVEPGFPTCLTGREEPAALETDRYRQFLTRGLRITLARWIVSPTNPLTARVMVNRMWQHHFGHGIVRTPSDFGRNGERPTHPELLDWLAARFVDSGWDIKAMHKLMLMSNAYRQSADNPADPDPDNRLFSRFVRRRLEAEAIRDGILAISGRLNPQRGGPSVFPPLPADLADFARYGRTGGLMWEPNEREDDARRRSVYVFQRRSLPLPMMAAFDATAFSESCDRRSSTTTPLQALSMMNGDLVHEESAHLAARIRKEAGEERTNQVRRAYALVLSRPPRAEELDRFASYAGDVASLCRVLLNSNEFLYME